MMYYNDSLEMKICFIYELLYSIRGDFGPESALKERKDLAIKLTKLAIKEFNERASFIKKYGECSVYKSYDYNKSCAKQLKILLKTIEAFKPFHQDGRYFRDTFPYGYQDMLEYFNLDKINKSLNALRAALKVFGCNSLYRHHIYDAYDSGWINEEEYNGLMEELNNAFTIG